MERAELGAEWGGLSEVEPVLRGWLWRRCRVDDDLDDVVQETLLRAARYRGGLAQPERLVSWTLTIAANTLRDRARTCARLRVAEESVGDVEELSEAPRTRDEEPAGALLRIGGSRVASDDALEHLRDALGALPEQEARLLLDYHGGARLADLAARQGVRPAALKCRLYRARRRLVRDVERRLAASTRVAGAPA